MDAYTPGTFEKGEEAGAHYDLDMLLNMMVSQEKKTGTGVEVDADVVCDVSIIREQDW